MKSINFNELKNDLNTLQIKCLIYLATQKHFSVTHRIRFLYFAESILSELIQTVSYLVNELSEKKDEELETCLNHFKDEAKALFNEIDVNIDILLYELEEKGFKFIFEHHEMNDQVSQKINFVPEDYDELTDVFIKELSRENLNFLVFWKKENGFSFVSLPAYTPKFYSFSTPEKNDGGRQWFEIKVFIKNGIKEHYPDREIENIFEFRLSSHFLFEIQKSSLIPQFNLINKLASPFSSIEVNQRNLSKFISKLLNQLNLSHSDVYFRNKFIFAKDLLDIVTPPNLMSNAKKINHDKKWLLSQNIFSLDKTPQDILIHHPYQSYEVIIQLLDMAAQDIRVKKIQVTLFRTHLNSKILDCLAKAAQNGVEVQVYIELLVEGGFEANLVCLEFLQTNKINVTYNSLDYKVHAKMLLITYESYQSLKYISLLSTGNFTEQSFEKYADFSSISFHQGIGVDLKKIFDFIFLNKSIEYLNHLMFTSCNLRQGLLSLFKKCKEAVYQGKEVFIFLKIKKFNDPQLLEALNGLEDKTCLFLRGDKLSTFNYPHLKKIKIYSYWGRFLEHHRVYYFKIGQKEYMYLGTASFKESTIDKRFELIFPIYDEGHIAQIKDEIINNIQKRRNNRWERNQHGEMIYLKNNDEDYQEYLIKKYGL